MDASVETLNGSDEKVAIDVNDENLIGNSGSKKTASITAESSVEPSDEKSV
jgi:hypothetical protein